MLPLHHVGVVGVEVGHAEHPLRQLHPALREVTALFLLLHLVV